MKHNSYFALYDDVQSTVVVVAVLRHQIWENNLKIEILGKSTVISHYYVIFFFVVAICARHLTIKINIKSRKNTCL